jgi:AcrR family transcriptional regulator
MQHHARMLQQPTVTEEEVARVPPRPTALDALKLARRRFQAAERIDMGAMAEELGVNRVTLYRWVGSRNHLLVETLWSLAEATLARQEEQARERGAERIVQIVTRFVDACVTNAGMRRLLSEEGELVMRLLTRRDAGFQPRLIDAIHRLLDTEARAGRLALPVDLREVAYVVVRLIESYVYLDLITGEPPDARRAEPVLRMLLR